MRIVMACWLVCVTACAASSPRPVAASRPIVDPIAEVVAIPHDICPAFGGWYAMTEPGLRRLLVNLEQSDIDHAVELERCKGAAKLAEQRQKQAEDAAAQGAWLARWGFPLGFGLGIGVAVLTGALFFGFVGK